MKKKSKLESLIKNEKKYIDNILPKIKIEEDRASVLYEYAKNLYSNVKNIFSKVPFPEVDCSTIRKTFELIEEKIKNEGSVAIEIPIKIRDINQQSVEENIEETDILFFLANQYGLLEERIQAYKKIDIDPKKLMKDEIIMDEGKNENFFKELEKNIILKNDILYKILMPLGRYEEAAQHFLECFQDINKTDLLKYLEHIRTDRRIIFSYLFKGKSKEFIDIMEEAGPERMVAAYKKNLKEVGEMGEYVLLKLDKMKKNYSEKLIKELEKDVKYHYLLYLNNLPTSDEKLEKLVSMDFSDLPQDFVEYIKVNTIESLIEDLDKGKIIDVDFSSGFAVSNISKIFNSLKPANKKEKYKKLIDFLYEKVTIYE